MDISHLRQNYRLKKLDRNTLKPNPIELFQQWLQEALECDISEANAAALATADAKGKPSCRMILLKHVQPQGFVFFTNYGSRKSHELEENPHASIAIYWKELERQVCIDGTIEKVSKEESEHYFAKRPRSSQISAWASKQGDRLKCRHELEEAFAYFEKHYDGKEIPLPPYWGGFCLAPERIEFWQGRPDRLHDRFSYTVDGPSWVVERLSP